jgi:hypothetical protein
MIRTFGRFAAGLAVITLGAGFGLLNAGQAGADAPTFVVNNTGDSSVVSPSCAPANDSVCTLREAIIEANATGGNATVSIPAAGTYAVDATIGQLLVNSDGDGNTISIIGADQSTVIIQANQCAELEVGDCSDTRVLKVETGTTAAISGVTIEGGDRDNGGGILNCGTLLLTDSTVTGNTATTSGGGIEQSSGGGSTLTGDTVSNNIVQDGNGGGGIDDIGDAAVATTMTITDSTITGNTIQGAGEGGGVLVTGAAGSTTALDISGSTISGNTANGDNGGGIAESTVTGGDISMTLTDSTVSSNTANGEGGGLYTDGGANANATLTGTTVSSNSATADGGGMAVETPGTLTFSGDSFDSNTANSDGESDGEGGGLYLDDAVDVNVVDSSFTNNDGYDGGGIGIEEYNTFTINSSTISGNTASEGGGGIYDDQDSIPALAVTNSTISGNRASGASGESPLLGDGGGFLDDFCSPVNMTNDTISGNTAANNGGGFDSEQCNLSVGSEVKPAVHSNVRSAHAQTKANEATADTLDAFLFDTFASNTAGNGSSGGDIDQDDDSSTMTLADSIVAYGVVNAVPTTNCAISSTNFTSLGYNLIDDNTCGTAGTGDIIGQDPLLAALANNGGPTLTQLPGPTSPAIGGVAAAACASSGVSSDQRGLPRPGGEGPAGSCTIGAVEPQAAVVPPPPTTNPNGYRMAAIDGGVFDFGIQFHGSLAGLHLNAPIVGIANNPGPNGYLLVGSDGGVFALGGANYFGSLGGQVLPAPVAAIAATPDGAGYWLVGATGIIYNYGDAPKLPLIVTPPADRVVGAASTNDGKGLWIVDNKGDVYTQGDAQFLGSLGGKHINAPIAGIAPAATGQGYVLVASDGGVFAFGVQFQGSVPGVLKPGQKLNAPAVGIAVTHSGNGYWVVGADGGVFCFGDAPFLGSTYTQLKPGQTLNGPIIGIQHLGGQTAA